jgi:hypothetical protein
MLMEYARFQVIELIQGHPVDIYDNIPTPFIQTSDAAQDDNNGLLRTSREFHQQEFFNCIGEDLRWFFEQFRDLENVLNSSSRNVSNNSRSLLSLYDIAVPYFASSRAGNATANSLHNPNSDRRGINLPDCTRENRTSTSIRVLSEYRLGRRREIPSDTRSVTSDGLSPRSQSPVVLPGVPRHRGRFPSARRRARILGDTQSHRLRPSPL